MFTFAARRVVLDGVDTDPLGAHALDIYGSAFDHPAGYARPLHQGRPLRTAMEYRRLGLDLRLMAHGHFRPYLRPGPSVSARSTRPGRHVWKCPGRARQLVGGSAAPRHVLASPTHAPQPRPRRSRQNRASRVPFRPTDNP